jgi:hypothetical protein
MNNSPAVTSTLTGLHYIHPSFRQESSLGKKNPDDPSETIIRELPDPQKLLDVVAALFGHPRLE